MFYDPAGARLPWLLKRGFRHCFACVRDGDYWLLVDGANGVPLVKLLAQADFDLAQFYRAEGYAVVETEQRTQPIRCPFSLANCVGLVKAVLAIRAPFAFTPWQLYRHMTRLRASRYGGPARSSLGEGGTNCRKLPATNCRKLPATNWRNAA